MKLITVCVSVAVFAAGVSCSSPPDLVTPNASFRFNSEVEQQQCEKRALAGDAAAADRLANYYAFVRHDDVKARHWYKIAAANGSKDAKESLRSFER